MHSRKVLASHNVFVNLSSPSAGSSRQALFNLPDGVVSASQGETLKISLTSFSMRRNGYQGIDSNSNAFFVVVRDAGGNVTFGKGRIPVGNYQSYLNPSFGVIPQIDFHVGAAATIAQAGLSCSAGYESVTGKMELDWTGLAAGSEVKLCCFTVLDSDPQCTLCAQLFANSTVDERFSSSFEILGGPGNDNQNLPGATVGEQWEGLKSVLDLTTATGGKSLMPLRLTYLENIYLRTNLPANNWQSSDFSSGSSRIPTFQLSNILAKIHVGNPHVLASYTGDGSYPGGAAGPPIIPPNVHTMNEPRANTISWYDNGANIFSAELPLQSLNEIEFTITDEYGRIIPAPSFLAEKYNLVGAELVLRIDALE